jgi:hypothetical protein
MTLLAGWALGLLSLGIVVAVIYFLRRQARSVLVSSLWLWRGAERQPKSALKLRWTQILPLLLQLMALGALTLGVAQPVIYTPAGGARTLAILIDGSAGMRAQIRPGGPTYYQRAVEEAIALLRANPAAEVTLIQAQERSVLLSPPSLDHAELRRLLLSSRPTYQGDADLSELISLLHSQAPQGFERVVFFTNSSKYCLRSRLRPCRGMQLEALGWELRPIRGQDVQNIGITRFAVRPQPQAGGYAIFLELYNSGDHTSRAALQLSADGELVEERRVEIPPKNTISLTLGYEGPSAARFVARLLTDDRDDWAEDNVRYGSLPKLSPWRVLWVGPPEFYLEGFMRLSSQVELEMQAEGEEGLTPQAFDLVLLHRVGLEEPTAGRFLLVGSPLPPWVVLGETRAAAERKITVKTDHPVIAGIDPEEWRLLRMREAEVDPEGAVLLESGGVPLLYLCETAGLRLAYLGVDLAASNLGLSVDFPILMYRLLSWLAPRGEEETYIKIGEELPLTGLEGPVEIRGPGGRSCRWREEPGCGLVERPGFYEVAMGEACCAGSYEGIVQVYAANIPSEEARSSGLGQTDGDDRVAVVVRTPQKSPQQRALLQLWPYLLGLGIFLLALELFYFDRPLIQLRFGSSRRRGLW